MIKIIEGSAASDVSGKMRETLCKALSENEKKIFLIVPDQFEFETEKTIYSDLDRKGLLTGLSRIKVTTFSALSRDILLYAGENMPAADDVVKSVVMNKAVREQKNMLSSLRGAADKTGFCEKMVNTISALKTAGLTAGDFDEKSGLFICENAPRGMNSLIGKLKDVGKIYKSYDNLLSKYADSLDYTKKASEIISRADNDFFDDTLVFVDCFNDFTGSQMEFIRRMTAKAENVVFAFVADTKDAPRENVFGRIFAQRDRIISYAENENIQAVVERDDLKKRLCAPLEELSEKIFGNEKSEIYPNGACETVSARDVFEEADYTAAKIKQLCLDKGLLYRETAVLCADASYGKYIRDAFEKYEIPFFLDIPEPILYQPLVNFFISLLNVLRNFNVDNILSCLKTGFYSKPDADGTAPISDKDIDVFENYIFEWNLSAKHIKKEFTFGDMNSLSRINAEIIRKAVAEPILRLREKILNKDGAVITREIYDFAANEVGIERTLISRCYSRGGNNSVFDSDTVRLNQQIWNSLAEIFDVFETELSGENISLDEYYRLFAEICTNTTLAKPPQYRDCVLVGDIDRTRADGVKAVFIVGASYEKLPAASDGMGIFSEYESELVTNLIRANADSDDIRAQSLKDLKEQYSLSLYRAYRAVCLPTEFLSISCSEYDASGNKISRSTIFGDIKRVFPDIKTIKAESLGDAFYCRSIRAVKQRYAASLTGENSQSADAMRAYLEANGYKEFVQKLDEIRESRSTENAYTHKISENTSKSLFKLSLGDRKNKLSIGATQVEKLIQCPFSFFCTKELGIREKIKREFNASNRGNALHYVMQNIFTKYKDNMDEFFKLGRNDFLNASEEILYEYLKTQTNGDHDDDKRTVFLFRNIASSAADLLITMQTELSVRSYSPQFFELNISNENKCEFTLDTNEFNGNLPDSENSLMTESGNPEHSDNSKNTFELLSKPLSLRLSDNTQVLIGGKLDRLDIMYAEKDNKPRLYLRVIDYKSKAKSFDKESAKNGENIQMLLYLTALCSANAENKTIEVLPGEISYIPSKNAGAAKTRLEAFHLLEMNHHPNGLYINDEFIENNLKNVTEKIAEVFKDIDEEQKQKIINEINSSFMLNGENSVTNEEFKELTDECIATVTKMLEKIYGGDISATPLAYKDKNIRENGISNSEQTEKQSKSSNDPCKFCELYGICKNPERQK